MQNPDTWSPGDIGGDQLLVDQQGNSEISVEDYAVAIADLLEKGGHERERICVAW